MEKRDRAELSTPDIRRARLKKTLAIKGLVCVMEAHSGLTGLIVEDTVVEEEGGARQFDAMWISSLCDSTAKGKPDIELVDMTSRFRTGFPAMQNAAKMILTNHRAKECDDICMPFKDIIRLIPEDI